MSTGSSFAATHTHSPTASRQYKYYDLIMALSTTVLICANFISGPKRVALGPFIFGAGVFFFPLSYIFGDILTEVYGYARSRKVVWAGFGCLLIATLFSKIVVALPPDSTWPYQSAWEAVFGGAWRVVLASMLAFFSGELVNSYVLAKMKIITSGKYLWSRTIGSTIAGELVDSFIFYPVAFLGQNGWPIEILIQVLFTNYALKVGWEIVATPLTYRVVAFLKKVENEDYYDYDTDFAPFSIKT